MFRAHGRGMSVVAAAIVLGTAGCAGGPHFVVAGKWSRFRPTAPIISPEVVAVQYLRIDREFGDKTMSEDLWRTGDDSFLEPKFRAALAGNGLRVARFSGNSDSALLSLIKDSNKRKEGASYQTQAGSSVKLELTDVVPKWSFFTVKEDRAGGETLENVQGYLSIVPHLKGESRVNLGMTPLVEFGEARRTATPAANLGGFEVKVERESRTLNDLKWSVEVGAGDVLVIGCDPERAGTVGRLMFIREKDGKRIQSVMIVRALRPSRDDLFENGYDINDFFLTPEANPAPTRSPVRETVQLSRPGALLKKDG
jgi:hypothetical protein